MTADYIRKLEFQTARKGYVIEDVQEFLLEVAETLEEKEAALERAEKTQGGALAQAIADKEKAEAERDALQKKIYILAQRVEEYRGQEETIKTALINAQRMGETVVHEAKQKGEQIIRDASGKGELLRQQAELEIQNERKVLEKLHSEVENFKATMLNLYKQHIESLSALDDTVKNSQAVLDELRAYDAASSAANASMADDLSDAEKHRYPKP